MTSNLSLIAAADQAEARHEEIARTLEERAGWEKQSPSNPMGVAATGFWDMARSGALRACEHVVPGGEPWIWTPAAPTFTGCQECMRPILEFLDKSASTFEMPDSEVEPEARNCDACQGTPHGLLVGTALLPPVAAPSSGQVIGPVLALVALCGPCRSLLE